MINEDFSIVLWQGTLRGGFRWHTVAESGKENFRTKYHRLKYFLE